MAPVGEIVRRHEIRRDVVEEREKRMDCWPMCWWRDPRGIGRALGEGSLLMFELSNCFGTGSSGNG